MHSRLLDCRMRQGIGKQQRCKFATAGHTRPNACLWASRNSMLLLAAGVPGWVTISQARFGGQISAIARQFQGLSTNSDPNVQQKM